MDTAGGVRVVRFRGCLHDVRLHWVLPAVPGPATRVGRYFTDMALWIYLVHLPLIPHLIWWIQPSRSSWLGASLTGMLVVTGVALVLYELFVRPTPLVYIFGPPQPRRVVPPPAPAAEGLAPT